MSGLTPAQLEERRAYLGGTDAAALAGVNPPAWAQPIDVYLEKVGLTEARPSSTMMSMGQRLEPVVADMFTEATGIRLRRWARTVRSKEYWWAGGHLDRWADDGAIFEAKWTMGKDEWGPGLGNDGTPEAPVLIPAPGDASYQPRVPARYAVQVQHYLAVTGRPLAYLAVLLGFGDFRWYALHRNEAMIANLMEIEEQFWREHVIPRVPPEPDGSEGYGRHLRALYAQDDGAEAVATPEQQALVADLRGAKASVAAAGQLEARVTQLLQDSMKATSKLVGPGFAITWKQTKPSVHVDWEALATMLAEHLEADDWPTSKKDQAEYMRKVARSSGLATEKPGARPFKPTFDSDEE